MSTEPSARKAQNMAHWGAFTTEVEDGRLVCVTPLAGDRKPSTMLRTIPGAHTWIVWRRFLNEVAPQMFGPGQGLTN